MVLTMIKAILSAFLCLLSNGDLNADTSYKGLINFEQIDLRQAQLSGKKILVSYTADWCLPCKMLESTLYNDKEIANLVNSNFQPVLVDIDSPIADAWSQHFEIEYLPTILFISGSGIESDRISKAPTRLELIETLKKIIAADHIPSISDHHIEPTAPISQVGSKKISKSIQLGAFSTYEAAQRRKEELSIVDGHHLIIEEQTNGTLLYKVVRHQFFTAEKLQVILKEYLNLGFEAFYRPC